MNEPADTPPQYTVILSDIADAEAANIGVWLAEHVSEDYAARWLEGLARAFSSLSQMPGRFAFAREHEAYAVSVRQMLYTGPSRKRGRSVYRVVFHIIEPTADDPEGVVRVLRVRHGAFP